MANFVFLAKLYHTKLKSTVRHPGVEVENALRIVAQVEL